MAAKFEILDYFIFGLTLFTSVGICLYFACFGKKQKNAKIYLYGSGKLTSIPIGLSLLSSAVTAFLIVGAVQEVYIFGIAYVTTILGVLLGLLVTWNLILPVFCGNLNLKTPYEYFERRFNSKVRVLLSVLYCFHLSIFTGIVLYACTISFSEASGIQLYICTTVIGTTCTLYTILGGFLGVIWTDVLQTVLMYSSCIFIVIKGFSVSGGFVNVLYEAEKGQRLNLFNFDPNPLIRTTIWSGTLGFCVLNVAHSSCAVSGIQRYMALQTEKEARVSASIQSYGVSLTKALCGLIGLCIYVFYKDCDPINDKKIDNSTQLLAFYLNDIIDNTKGFVGLFTAGILSAGLSSISAELNAVSGLVYYDILQKIFNFSDNDLRATVIMKFVVLVYGILMIIIAPLLQYSKYVYQIGLTFCSWTYGVKFGVMILATCFPKVNSWGVFTGILFGFATTAWISINGNIYKVSSKYVLPRSIENCNVGLNITTTTFSNITSSQIPTQLYSDYPWIYDISFLYYPVIGAIVTILVGIVVSYITGVNDVYNMDTRLIIPCMRPTEDNDRKCFRNIFKQKPNVDNNEMQPI